MAPVTHQPKRHDGAGAVTVLRWTFVRGTRALTCEVRANGRHSYDLCVIPHWAVASAVVERYDRPATAFQRHAQIAESFRLAGWVVVREGAARGNSHAA